MVQSCTFGQQAPPTLNVTQPRLQSDTGFKITRWKEVKSERNAVRMRTSLTPPLWKGTQLGLMGGSGNLMGRRLVACILASWSLQRGG